MRPVAVVMVVAGSDHCLAPGAHGAAYSWGGNYHAALGRAAGGGKY